ncbi:breast carcinoma-amplified sequence 1 isoform X3 [Silurus meridionalis]|uniref:breast carcinoma-amplified sequence 1 isoform X3 n=1 Tax=Silurus meridionalis TaxID=175797 RepID=UPI001EE9DA10|nr:breast carcinoma-amplified sequence 1 isoform X3 [Silurus meridionalis]
MGNRQSLTITHPETDHNEKKEKNDQPNGHAVSGLDLTDAVTCEASKPAPVTFTFNVKPTQASVETNGTKAKATTVSVEAVSATTASVEKEIPAESSTPTKDTSKPAGTPSMFNKMFKMKTGPADVAAEVAESQKSTPTSASIETNGIQAKAPSMTVDAPGLQISASTASTEKEVPTETSTPAKDTSKQAGTPSKFNMMFKKKPVAADVAAEVKIVPAVLTESQKSTPTQVSVATNGIQEKAPSVTVDANGIQISASTASADKEVPTETSTPAKDTSKQAGTPSKFNMMFKKKPGAADVATEVKIVPAVLTESQKSTPTQVSVATNGIQAKAPSVTVDATGIQISASTASAEKEVPTETSTPAKDTSKQAGTPSKFNMMFKKKPGAADVAAEVAESQKSTPTSASIETNGIQANIPTVSLDAAGIQISASTASTEKEIPTETSTPAKDTSKQAGTPSKFNMMFKKKPVAADVAAEVKIVPTVVTESQKSTPTQVSVTNNGIQAKAPSVTVDATGIQISASTASAEKEVPTETSTPAKDTSKQAGTPSKFNMMFKKKPVAADVATEVKIVPKVLTESQKSTPTQVSVATNRIQAKAPSVTVDAAGLQISASTASAEKEVPTETSTPAKDTSKQAGTPSKFNMMFKKKPGAADVAAEVKIVPTVLTESQKSTPTQVSVATNGIQAKAPSVTVDATGIQISASTASAEKEVPTETSTPAKDTSKQAGTPSKFNMMFKKKPGAADVAAEVAESQKSTPTSASIETNGIQANIPTVTVDAAGIQISASTASTEKEVPTESSTPAKDTSKQAGTPSKFNMMFKKKPVAADVAAEVKIVPKVVTESQKSTPTQVSVATNGIQAKAPSVTVDAAGLQISASTASTEKEVPTETSTPAKDTSKQAGTPSKFNMMFKKKPGAADVATEVKIVPAVLTESQKSTPTQVSVATNGIQAKAPSVTVDAPGLQISASTASAEKEVPTETSTPAKDTSKQAGTPSKFNMMFKKKPGAADVATEVKIVPAVLTESQKSTPTQVSVATNGIQAKAPSVTVDAPGLQISASTASAEKEVPTETSTPAKDTSKQAGTPSKFNMMFKKKPVAADVAAEVKIVPAVLTESQQSIPTQVSVKNNGIQAPSVTVDAAGIQINATTLSAEKETPAESGTAAKDTPKQAETPSMFNKMFKKKPGAADVAAEVTILPAEKTESQKFNEPTDIKASPQADKEPQNEALVLSTTVVTQDSTQSEQTGAEEKSVMNFFKTFVTSTKTTKEATPSPDVSKEQSQKETPPAPAANVQEASKVPPPPPPAPPKMESKAEPAVKKEQAPAVEVAAAAAKEPEAQSKAKTKDSPFSKIFRSKVDASKASTLEVSAKPEHPPAPKPEEKKAEKKPSPFANLLKPKVLLGQVSSKIHAAASSASASISLGARGAATESKKQTPAAPTAPADAAPSTKAKEEPKQAASAAPAATSADNKSVGSTDNSSPSTSRKLEKRNSIHLFFKNLGQKRHSDAGVQTEPVAPEKAK